MMSSQNLRRFILPILCVLLTPASSVAQKCVRLKMPQKENTGAYHGEIYVKDATFINNDQHVVVVVNECLAVFDVKTGRRLNTVLNRRRDEAYGNGGHYVSMAHVVNEGAALLTDPIGSWRSPGPGSPRSEHRWMVWDAYQLGIPSQPSPRPFFSHKGLSEPESLVLNSRLDFIQQIGSDFLFLHNFKSDEDRPTSIRVFRDGDRIDQPIQQIPFQTNPTTLYVVLREPWRPPFFVGPSPNMNTQQTVDALTQCDVLKFSHDSNGQVLMEVEDLEASTALQNQIARTQCYSADLGVRHWRALVSRFTPDADIDAPVGLTSHAGNLIAVSGGKLELWTPLRQRTQTPAIVKVYDRESSRWSHNLPCGKGSLARPLAFSHDDSMLLTVQDLARPQLAIWHLNGR